uniref:Uncharacterized protein n=1 Tax=Glossina pallidipes TaxID=7398 RepID=A0A1A9ZUC6_GLOPL
MENRNNLCIIKRKSNVLRKSGVYMCNAHTPTGDYATMRTQVNGEEDTGTTPLYRPSGSGVTAGVLQGSMIGSLLYISLYDVELCFLLYTDDRVIAVVTKPCFLVFFAISSLYEYLPMPSLNRGTFTEQNHYLVDQT